MHITVAMSCHHKAASDPNPHMPTCPVPASACPHPMLRAQAALMPPAVCSWLPVPWGVPAVPRESVASPHFTLAVLNHGLRISGSFATPSLMFPCTQVPTMCFLLPHFQMLLLEVHALLPSDSFAVHPPSPALIFVSFLPSFLFYDLPPSLCLLKKPQPLCLVTLPPSPSLIPLNSLQPHMEMGPRVSCQELFVLFVPSNRFGQISFWIAFFCNQYLSPFIFLHQSASTFLLRPTVKPESQRYGSGLPLIIR